MSSLADIVALIVTLPFEDGADRFATFSQSVNMRARARVVERIRRQERADELLERHWSRVSEWTIVAFERCPLGDAPELIIADGPETQA